MTSCPGKQVYLLVTRMCWRHCAVMTKEKGGRRLRGCCSAQISKQRVPGAYIANNVTKLFANATRVRCKARKCRVKTKQNVEVIIVSWSWRTTRAGRVISAPWEKQAVFST